MNKATIVVGLGFGDEGKGSIVDFLCREQIMAPVVVRFNGGSQAAHNVITPDGRHHTFAQFGSGMFVPNTVTYLSRFSLVDLFSLDREAHALAKLGVSNPYGRLSIDERALIITPFQKAANRLREALRKDRHGSCGMGIGETTADSLATPPLLVRAADLLNEDLLTEKLAAIQKAKYSEFHDRFKELTEHQQLALRDEITMLHDPGAPRLFAEAMGALANSLTITGAEYLKELAEDHPLIFEGAQGVLLDEWYGFHPHTTWSTTTTANALSILDEIEFQGEIERLGLLRAYHTRHGAGPFPSVDPELSKSVKDLHNGTGPWQGEFRVGHFDLVLARYALSVCDVDSLVITNMDRLEGREKKVVVSYIARAQTIEELPIKTELEDLNHQEKLTNILQNSRPILTEFPQDSNAYIEALAQLLEKPVSIVSRGPSAREKVRLELSEVS